MRGNWGLRLTTSMKLSKKYWGIQQDIISGSVSFKRLSAKRLFPIRTWKRWLMPLGLVFAIACNSEMKSSNAVSDSTAIPMTNPSVVPPASPPANYKHERVTVNGLTISYIIGGAGPPLVLVHGFGENWYVWNRLLPGLSRHFTVIVPELRGISESDRPAGGYDKKTMAKDIHELVKKLGYPSINLVGHDIGLMVAYAYASQFGREVKKVALLDAMLPGIEPVWQHVSTTAWHFGFFSRPIAGDLVTGKEGAFLRDFWPQQFGKNKGPF